MNKKFHIKKLSILALVVVLCLIPVFVTNIYWIHVFILSWINVLLAASLRTISRTNQFSLGHAGFMALGAYTSALLMKAGFPFWAAFSGGGLMAAVVAFAVGYPFLRVKGIYFAILTLLLAEVFRLTALYWKSLTGGMRGLSGIPSPDPLAIPLIGKMTFGTKTDYYYLVLVIVMLSLFILYRLEHSRLGDVWMAIKESDVLAQSVGIRIMWHKVLNFSIGCFFAGVAGALFAHYLHVLSPGGSSGGKFGTMTSIFIMTYMVVGGQGMFAGPVIGASLLTIIPEIARPLKEYQPLIFGGLLIFIVFLMPEGIVGLGYQLKRVHRVLCAGPTTGDST